MLRPCLFPSLPACSGPLHLRPFVYLIDQFYTVEPEPEPDPDRSQLWKRPTLQLAQPRRREPAPAGTLARPSPRRAISAPVKTLARRTRNSDVHGVLEGLIVASFAEESGEESGDDGDGSGQESTDDSIDNLRIFSWNRKGPRELERKRRAKSMSGVPRPDVIQED